MSKSDNIIMCIKCLSICHMGSSKWIDWVHISYFENKCQSL